MPTDPDCVIQEVDFQTLIAQSDKEEQLMQSLVYVTEYMRQVIENGTNFSQNHFFILMLQMRPE